MKDSALLLVEFNRLSIWPFFYPKTISRRFVDAIRETNQYFQEIQRVLLFEEILDPTRISEVVKLYGLDKSNLILQFQHRVNKNFIDSVRTRFNNSVIATIGLQQIDFKEYFDYLNNILSPNDSVLVDCSVYQPDLLLPGTSPIDLDKLVKIQNLTDILDKGDVPIFIADDGSCEEMASYIDHLKTTSISLAGVDIQNVVEMPSAEQRYISLSSSENQALVRKCPDRIRAWDKFVEKYVHQ